MSDKATHVLKAGQTRRHACHWPGCKTQVTPAMWGCRQHWMALPKAIRHAIWSAYEVGQEERGDPSPAYIDAAQAAQDWIKKVEA